MTDPNPDDTSPTPRRNPRGALTHKILHELAAGATWAEAAAAAGCSRSSVARRARDPEFRQRLAEERSARLRRLADKLTDRSVQAIDTLAAAMVDESAPWPSRVRAAAWVIRLGMLTREEGMLEARVTALEALARPPAGLRAIPGGGGGSA